MAKKFNLKVLGVSKVIAQLKKKSNDVDNGIEKALRLVALNEEKNVKLSISGQKAEPKSVDTGRFMNSIRGTSGKDYAEVSSSVNYSWYLEMGTSKIGARHHFQNTLARDKQLIQKYLKEAIRVDLII